MSSFISTTRSSIEERFKEIKSVVSEYNRKKNLLSTDREVREYYTNKEVQRRYLETVNNHLAPPPLLKTLHRTEFNSERVDFLEASTNLDIEFSKKLSKLNTFTLDELKYIVKYMREYLVYDLSSSERRSEWIHLNMRNERDVFVLEYDGCFYVSRMFRNDGRVELLERECEIGEVKVRDVYLDVGKV